MHTDKLKNATEHPTHGLATAGMLIYYAVDVWRIASSVNIKQLNHHLCCHRFRGMSWHI